MAAEYEDLPVSPIAMPESDEEMERLLNGEDIFSSDEEVVLKQYQSPISSDAVLLHGEGLVVIPFYSREQVTQIVWDLDEVVLNNFTEFPEEYGRGRIHSIRGIKKEGPKFVCGGFGALGNPSSFHNMVVRKMRLEIFNKLKPFWKGYYEAFLKRRSVTSSSRSAPPRNWRFHAIVDRLMLRAIGDKATPESWHRDTPISEHVISDQRGGTGDHIFGGWVNLNLEDQKFSYIEGSHLPGYNPRNGFAKEMELSHDQIEKKKVITIPPGHILIFYENIIHEVVSSASKHVVMRLFLGWRFCLNEEPLMGNEDFHDIIEFQDVFPLKSGQNPRMWPKLYTVNHVPLLNKWFEQMFGISDYKSQEAKDLFDIKEAKMLPLWDTNSTMFPDYTPEEIDILVPEEVQYAF